MHFSPWESTFHKARSIYQSLLPPVAIWVSYALWNTAIQDTKEGGICRWPMSVAWGWYPWLMNAEVQSSSKEIDAPDPAVDRLYAWSHLLLSTNSAAKAFYFPHFSEAKIEMSHPVSPSWGAAEPVFPVAWPLFSLSACTHSLQATAKQTKKKAFELDFWGGFTIRLSSWPPTPSPAFRLSLENKMSNSEAIKVSKFPQETGDLDLSISHILQWLAFWGGLNSLSWQVCKSQIISQEGCVLAQRENPCALKIPSKSGRGVPILVSYLKKKIRSINLLIWSFIYY